MANEQFIPETSANKDLFKHDPNRMFWQKVLGGVSLDEAELNSDNRRFEQIGDMQTEAKLTRKSVYEELMQEYEYFEKKELAARRLKVETILAELSELAKIPKAQNKDLFKVIAYQLTDQENPTFYQVSFLERILNQARNLGLNPEISYVWIEYMEDKKRKRQSLGMTKSKIVKRRHA